VSPKRVYEAPSGRDLPFTFDQGIASTVLPSMQGHAMVVFEP
jgi:hypothetical protein